jgi:ABC-type glycerol-3-phosphate transport system substrate-binding protein
MSLMDVCGGEVRVLFDIMTGLERLVQPFFNTDRVTGRYLTLFYGITLGLGLVMAIIAIGLQGNEPPEVVAVTATKASLNRTAAPTQKSTLSAGEGTPTSLPGMPPTPNVKTPSTLGVTTADLQGVQVSLWHPWTGAAGKAFGEILDEFNRNTPWGISVKVSGYEDFGRLDEAVEAALLENAQPDVIVDFGYQARHWDAVDALVDLSPYVNDPVWGMGDDEQADFQPSFWAEDLVNNNQTGQTRRLGIPLSRSAYVLFYNQSWAQELGYPRPPVTADDFRVRACAAAQYVREQGDKASLGKGGWLITSQPGELVGWIFAFGGEVTNPKEPGYMFNTYKTREAFETLKELQNSGCAWMDSAANPQVEFNNRQALFVVGSLFDIPAQNEAFARAGNQDEWMVIPFPSKSQPVVNAYGPSMLVTRSNPARQLAAWLVTKWLVYPPNQAEWVKVLEAYPTRLSTLDYLGEAAQDNPQWAQALELLPQATSEPSLASWRVVRWALEDVMKQLLNPQFSTDQIPELLEKLDSLAQEIYSQVY